MEKSFDLYLLTRL